MTRLTLLTLIACTTLSAAQAASPQYCEKYAKDAIFQRHRLLETGSCALNYSGTKRFSNAFQQHFSWCLQVPAGVANHERQARDVSINKCDPTYGD